ncbi:MAG: peptidase [Chloroflexi bacterium]|nr:peptidase [Chloroflexota bacterium]
MIIFDAHEDIAVNALYSGRDVRQSALETRRVEFGSDTARDDGLCMVGLPEWLSGRISVIFGTIFAPPASRSNRTPYSYTSAQEAHELGIGQLEFYHRLADETEQVGLVQDQADLASVISSWDHAQPRVGIVLLMEGADPIREPAELEMWVERGVRIVGLSWGSGSRYAGGNDVPGLLTDEGRGLLEVMADMGVTLDVSHLAEQAFDEALDRFEGRVIASHANPRAFVPSARMLSDRMITRLIEQDAVIGIVPYNAFLQKGWTRGDAKEAVTVADVAAAIDHVCQLAGDATHVGLGSDFDGGFGAESTPVEIDTVADLQRVGTALTDRGYAEGDVEAILSGNWKRLLKETLPG